MSSTNSPPKLSTTERVNKSKSILHLRKRQKQNDNYVSLDGLKYPCKSIMTSRKLFTKFVNGVIA